MSRAAATGAPAGFFADSAVMAVVLAGIYLESQIKCPIFNFWFLCENSEIGIYGTCVLLRNWHLKIKVFWVSLFNIFFLGLLAKFFQLTSFTL